MNAVTRYLMPEEKERIVREWDRAKRQLAPERAGGRGFPDPNIIPWCDRINALSGVVTLQSCEGHGPDDGEPSPGHLWLKMSERVAAAFNRRAHELAGLAGVERVALLFQPWGEEVASVTFAGSERNSLPDSLTAILGFLRAVCAEASGG